MARRKDFDDDETNEFFERDDDFEDFKDSDDFEGGETIPEESDDDRGESGDKTVYSDKKRKSEIFGFIVIKKGKRKNDKYDLTKEDVIIGRSSKCCDIVLDDEEVSKIHCRIRKDPDKNEFHFFDCGSTNGTMVNNEVLHTKILQSHDVITLGESVELIFIQV
ncbi:MAG: FHA domain-containing protein [Ignavibacteriales bacterium]|nr:FHA domain-containing protein [Ignavibacteriales bacterium]